MDEVRNQAKNPDTPVPGVNGGDPDSVEDVSPEDVDVARQNDNQTHLDAVSVKSERDESLTLSDSPPMQSSANIGSSDSSSTTIVSLKESVNRRDSDARFIQDMSPSNSLPVEPIKVECKSDEEASDNSLSDISASSNLTCDFDDDEILQEPKIKYEYLSSDLREILTEDSCSAFAVHSKFMVIGTHSGKVTMLDAFGHVMPAFVSSSRSNQEKIFSKAINHICIDHAGEYVGYCSADGKVQITGLLTSDHNLTLNLNKPIRSISIDPIFGRSGSGKRFMTGDEKHVLMHEKSLFNRYKQTVIWKDEGPVNLIKWRGRFSAFSTSKGIRVYDVVEEKMISWIKDEDSASAEPFTNHTAPHRIGWKDQFNLIVSMRDHVKICIVRPRKKEEKRGKDLTEYKVEITCAFQISGGGMVCGLAPFDHYVIALTIPTDTEEKKPRFKLLEPQDFSYCEVSSDVIDLAGYDKYRLKDYHLECIADEKQYFIVSPKNILLGKQRDADDHIDWMLEYQKYGEALEFAEENKKLLSRHSVFQVGMQYLDFLVGEAEFTKVGQLCIKLFAKNQELWEEELTKLRRLNQLRSISSFVPTGPTFKLDKIFYNAILSEYIAAGDSNGLLNLIQTWPSDLYRHRDVSNELLKCIDQKVLFPEDENVVRSWGILFSLQGKYDKAIDVMLDIGHQDVFDLIVEHNLYDEIHGKYHQLMQANNNRALSLFLEHVDKFKPDDIVASLKGRYLFYYLDALVCSKYESSIKYHEQVVEAYADFDQQKLLPFLKSSDYYPIKEALKVCRDHCYIEEQVFVLEKMGSTKEALNLITENLLDIDKAVEFCKSQDDPSLWNDLIDFSIDKPLFIQVLLKNIGSHMDPMILIRKIEQGQEIPGLRDSLGQIIQDCKVRVSLEQGYQRIMITDSHDLVHRQVTGLDRGFPVLVGSKCHVCGYDIVDTKRLRTTDVVLFRCHHAFHLECLGESAYCEVCCKT